VVESELNRLIALVTGAEVAFRFGANGAYTPILYHQNLLGATAVLEKIRQAGEEELIHADLSKGSRIAEFSNWLQSSRTPIGILVNNASPMQRKPFLEITEQLWSEFSH
jgi:short-subunit dehydrogenase